MEKEHGKISFVRKNLPQSRVLTFCSGLGLKCLAAESNETPSSSEQRRTPVALWVIRLRFGK